MNTYGMHTFDIFHARTQQIVSLATLTRESAKVALADHACSGATAAQLRASRNRILREARTTSSGAAWGDWRAVEVPTR